MLRLRLLVVLNLSFALLGLLTTAVYSQDKSPDVSVHVDLGQLKSSKVGSDLISFAKSQAQQEMGENLNWEDVEKSLGFDPVEEIASIHVATSFESPDTSAVVSVNFKNTTGNLEGLMLATPNYETTKVSDHTVHSADFDGKRVYAVIMANPQGGKALHLSLNQSNIKQLLENKSSRSLSFSDVLQKGKIVQVHVENFPAEMLGDGPHVNIVKLINSVDLAAGESGKDFAIDLDVTVADEEKAEQIRQIAQGLVGALGLASSLDPENSDISQIKSFVKGLEAKRTGNKVNVNFSVDGDQVTKMISNELK